MKVLVTGGTGYIGSHLVSEFCDGRHTIRVLDLGPAGDGYIAERGCEFVQGNLIDADATARAVRDVEVVYHLAWGFYPGDPYREARENFLGTLNLLEAALAAGVRHTLFASTAVVYGPTDPARVDEGHPCHPEKSTIGGPVYGVLKLACEKLCLAYGHRGLPATVFRLHGVFSAGRLGPFGRMIEQALKGEPVQAVRGAGGEYVHLEDVLRAFRLVANHPRAHGEVFNLAGSHTYREPELARYIVERTGSRSQVELVEDPTQKMISISVEKIERILGWRPERGEYLSGLIRCAIDAEATGS